MNQDQTPNADLLDALTGLDASSERAVALKTRRAVYTAAVEQRTERNLERRHFILALFILAILTLALAPALWSGAEDVFSGSETLLDLPGMLAALGLTMFAAVIAVLFLISMQRRSHTGSSHGLNR